MITFEQFKKYNLATVNFLTEQEKFNEAMDPFTCHSMSVTIGDELLIAYIESIENHLFDNEDDVIQGWYGWFVFENEFGLFHLKVIIEGETLEINSYKDFYKMCKLINSGADVKKTTDYKKPIAKHQTGEDGTINACY